MASRTLWVRFIGYSASWMQLELVMGEEMSV
jgi:hypothetical protein